MLPADLEIVASLTARRDDLGRPLSVWGLGEAYEQSLDAASGKRRRQGSYFTSEGVVRDIVRRTLAPILAPIAGDLAAVLRLRILDPAMGCGGFLAVALDVLADAVGATCDSAIRRRLAEQCLFGVDSDRAAVGLARVAITRAVGGSGHGDGDGAGLSANLRWGDSLAASDVPPVDWLRDFAAGFDAVVGNPPYLQEARGNSELFRRLRQSPVVGEHCERMTDLFHLFVCLGLSLLRDGGRLGMIVPDYWLTRTGASKVRGAILEGCLAELILFGDTRMFADAPGHHSSILVVQNRPPPAVGALAGARVLEIAPDTDPLAQLAEDEAGAAVVRALHGRFLVLDRAESELLEAMQHGERFRLPKGCVTNGLQSYPDRIDGEGVFVLTDDEVEALRPGPAEQALLQPFVSTRDIRRFAPAKASGLQVLYIDTPTKKLVEANAGGAYDRVRAHLERFADHMTSVAAPYGLHRPRRREFFIAKHRLVMPRKCDRPLIAPVDEPLYGDESSNFMVVPDGVSRDGLLGVLASSLAHFFFWHLKRQGTRLQLDTEVLLQLPLPLALREGGDDLARLERAVQQARTATGQALLQLEGQIDGAVAGLYGISMSTWRPAAGRFTACGGGVESPTGATV